MKKLFGDIIQIQNISPNMMIMCYIAPEIWCVTDVVFIFHSNLFFVLLPPARDIIILHMCTKNYDDMMYCSRDMVRNRDGQTDRRMDKKSDIQRWVPYLKTKPNFFFFPTSYPHKKSIKCANFGSLAEFHQKS